MILRQRPTQSSVANEEQYYTAATYEHDAEDARHPLPQLTCDPPLPSGLAPMITPEEAAAVAFANRRDFMRFLLYPGAFGAMIAAGRQPFWVWKNLPDTHSFGALLVMMPSE